MSTENKGDKTSLAVIITAIATLITAMGGLIYAWKSKDLSEANPVQNIKPWLDNKSSEKIFYGKVGKLETTFNLTFDPLLLREIIIIIKNRTNYINSLEFI